jgi:mannan endo-1,4-beta-mannosidase
MKALAIVLATLLPIFAPSSHQTDPFPNQNEGFVTTQGTQFMLDGRPYYFAGTNVYDFFTFGDGGSTESTEAIEQKFMDKKRIDAHMARLARDGVQVVRLWGFSHENWHGFEPAPGVYSEPQFMLFDYLLVSAGKHGIRLIITLENFWEAYGGIDKRLEWEGLPTGERERGRFFTCGSCNNKFKDYIRHFVTRINHYTNIPYRDDPTIFAWELMNEPRYRYFGDDVTSDVLREWVDDIGSFIKELDPNHLISSGIEGQGSKYGFGSDNGADFVKIGQSPYIDFTSAHPYPTEPWANLSVEQTKNLIRRWVRDSHEIVKKPFFLGEFNTEPNHGDREAYWKAIYSVLEETDAGGSCFWWYPDRKIDEGRHGVVEGSPELKIFTAHSKVMQDKSAGNVVLPRSGRFNQFVPQDLVLQVYPLKGSAFSGIRDGKKWLTEGEDYHYENQKVTLFKNYLEQQPLGDKKLIMVFAPLQEISYTVGVVYEEPQAALEKDFAEVSSSAPQDVVVGVKAQDNSISGIILDEGPLAARDFSFDGGKLVFKKEFVASLNPGTYTLTIDFRYGKDLTFKLNVIDGSMVEDFEAYADSDELRRAFVRNPGGNNIVAELVTTDASGQLMSYQYTIGNPSYAGLTRQNHKDWTGFTGLEFWLAPDESRRELVVQLHEQSGEYWEAVLSLDQKEAFTPRIPFKAFRHPPWSNYGNGVVDLNQIVDFSFYVGGAAGSGTIFIDTVKLW